MQGLALPRWLLWGLCPGMMLLSSLYPLGNASSAAFAEILSQFGQSELEQVTDKGPAVRALWCGGGDAAQEMGMQQELVEFGGF